MAFLEVVPALRLGGIWVVFLDDFWAFSGLYFDGLCAVLMAFFMSFWGYFWGPFGCCFGEFWGCLRGVICSSV